jgi:hypothetical protein
MKALCLLIAAVSPFFTFAQRNVKNEELLYLICHLETDTIVSKYTADSRYFARILAVKSKSVYTEKDVGNIRYIPEKYYYILSSAIGESGYATAMLFRTDDMIDPVIEAIEEVPDESKWRIRISYIKGKGKEKEVGRAERADRRTATVDIGLPQ